MARNITVGNVVLRARRTADLEDDGFISDAEAKDELSSFYGDMYGIFVQSGMRYFETRVQITGAELTSDSDGGATLTLPSDFLTLIGVDRRADVGGNRWVELEPLMAQDRNAFADFGTGVAIGYALIGQTLQLIPEPPVNQVYRYFYVPQPAQLAGASDALELDVVTPDGETFLTYSLATWMLEKEQTDHRAVAQERDRARQRLEEWALIRMLNEPRRPVTRDDYDFGFRRWGGEYFY